MNRRDDSRHDARPGGSRLSPAARPPVRATSRTMAVPSLLLAALLAVPAAATGGPTETTAPPEQEERAQRGQRAQVEMRRYSVRHVNLESARMQAEAICTETRFNEGDAFCRVEGQLRDALILIATPEVHERFARELAEIDVPPRSQRFHIAVLEVVEGAGTPAAELPDGAVGALEDLQSFLPYESFRLLANGWLETAREGFTTLSGPGSFELAVSFRGDPKSGDTLMVEFRLTAVPLSAEEIRAWERSGESLPRRVVLETSFGIDVGETKVLGTSKLNGDGNALVVLLTALE